MKKLYKFFWDEGRDGKIEGVFIAEETDIKEAIGKKVIFGSILGKFSDIFGTLDKDNITEIKVSETTVKEMEEALGPNISGYNPLMYIEHKCCRCEEFLSADDCDLYITENGEKICEDCATEEEKKTLTKLF